MKKDKKKVGSAAAAATTAMAGAAAVAMSATGAENDYVDAASDDAAVAEPQESLVDGGTLPEVEVSGEAPTIDGGMLADAVVTGHAPEAPVADAVIEDVAELASAESLAAEQQAVEQQVAEAELIAEAEQEEMGPLQEVAVVNPVEDVVAEPDFGEEFDDEDGDVAMAEAAPGSIAEQLLHKAEEKLSDLFTGGAHTDEQDFQNMADASEFMYQD